MAGDQHLNPLARIGLGIGSGFYEGEEKRGSFILKILFGGSIVLFFGKGRIFWFWGRGFLVFSGGGFLGS